MTLAICRGPSKSTPYLLFLNDEQSGKAPPTSASPRSENGRFPALRALLQLPAVPHCAVTWTPCFFLTCICIPRWPFPSSLPPLPLIAITMSAAKSRLSSLLGHFVPAQSKGPTAPSAQCQHSVNFHTLSPTTFLPRAAAIEPEVSHRLIGWCLVRSGCR